MYLIKRGRDRRANSVRSIKYYVNNKEKVVFTRECLIKRVLLDSFSDMQVVIKIGDQKYIDQEYNINQQLKHFTGFSTYICEFSCLDKLNKYIPRESLESLEYLFDPYQYTSFCEDKTFSIIMPYYPLGNISSYPWNASNFEHLKNIIRDITYTLINTNKEIGFLHNNLHLENFLIKETETGELKCDIIDFELSTINEFDKMNYKKLGQNFRKLFVDLYRLDLLDASDILKIILFTNKMREVTISLEQFDIIDIFDLIDDLKMSKTVL